MIRELFAGHLGECLEEARASNIFGAIRHLLREQIERCSGPEQQVLRVLAVEREPMRLPALLAALGPRVGRGAVLEAIEAKEYVRQTQERLLGAPIVQALNAQHGPEGTQRRLLALLDGWRDRPLEQQGYGPGTVVNLLRLLRGDLRGLDFSRVRIRQAYLQEVEAQAASLAGARVTETVLGEALRASSGA